ncbi:hypothetical protein FRB90_009052 [Tulasnella sp. 427]|nr:hypothetical protein FRB90_009052 [Tulasnella sp. 427]
MHQYPAYPPPIGAAALVPRYPTPELLNPGSAAAALMLQNPGYAAPNLFSQAETAPATNQGPSHMAYHLLGKPEANLAPVPYRTVSPGLYFTQPVPLNQPEILIDPALLKQQDSVATLVNHPNLGHPEHAKEEPTFAGLAYPHYVDPRELEYQSDDEDDVDYSQYSEPEDLESYHSPDDTPLPITKDTEAIRELFIAELRKEGLLDEETKQARPAPRRLTRINRTTTSS